MAEALRNNIIFDVSMKDVDLNTAYVPIPITSGINAYIPEKQIKSLINIINTKNTFIFTLKFKDTISFTVTKRNTSMGTIGSDFVSTNHCQHGSTILYYSIVELENETQIETENIIVPRNLNSIFDEINIIPSNLFSPTNITSHDNDNEEPYYPSSP